MANRQTRNISLPPSLDALVQEQLKTGRFSSASEVVREGLRLLEQQEHRRLVEKWIFGDISDDELKRLPAEVKERARSHFQGLVAKGIADLEGGRVVDGPEAMQRIRKRLRKRTET